MLRYAPSVLAAAAVLVAEAHDEAAAMAAAAALQARCCPCLLPTGSTAAQVVLCALHVAAAVSTRGACRPA